MFKLTLLNPSKGLVSFLGGDLCVNYSSHKLLDRRTNEYTFNLLGSNGKLFTVEGEASQLFKEPFEDLHVDYLLGTDSPCPSYEQKFTSLEEAKDYAIESGCPGSVKVDDSTVYVITEQAFKYMLGNCNKSELFDLGFLGTSEKHVKVVEGVLPRVKL